MIHPDVQESQEMCMCCRVARGLPEPRSPRKAGRERLGVAGPAGADSPPGGSCVLCWHGGASSSHALPLSLTWLLGFLREHPLPFREDGGQLLETRSARNGDESLPKGRIRGTGEHQRGPNEPPGEEGERAGGGMSEVTKK